MADEFKTSLVQKYLSTHYGRFVPKTPEGWAWVLERIDTNFGDVFSSLGPQSRILDLACGVGYLEDYLLKEGFENIESIDLSSEQIEVAKQILRERGRNFEGKIRFVVADAFDYLAKSSQFDLVAMFDIIEHFSKEEIGRLLGLTYAALRPGGLLIVRTINADNPTFGRYFYHDFTHETPFTFDSMRQCLEGAGFRVQKLDYEKPTPPRNSRAFMRGIIRRAGLRILAKFLQISPAAFTEDLVVVAAR